MLPPPTPSPVFHICCFGESCWTLGLLDQALDTSVHDEKTFYLIPYRTVPRAIWSWDVRPIAVTDGNSYGLDGELWDSPQLGVGVRMLATSLLLSDSIGFFT